MDRATYATYQDLDGRTPEQWLRSNAAWLVEQSVASLRDVWWIAMRMNDRRVLFAVEQWCWLYGIQLHEASA